MSYESMDRPAIGLLAKIRQAVFGLPHPPPKYAHPWSAYSPINFQKDDTARNIVPTQATRITRPVADVIQQEVTRPLEKFASQKATNRCEYRLDPPEIAAVEIKSANTSHFEVIVLELIKKQNERRQAAARSEPAARIHTQLPPSGIDFQLAARLRSVSILNRKITATQSLPVRKRDTSNRLAKPPAKVKRRLTIEPPAIRRRKRLSAEVVYFRRTFARAEDQQVRLSLVA